MKCFVPSCPNMSDKRRPQGVTFHRVPEASKHEWLQAIKRSIVDLSDDKRVCSEHFLESDFFVGNRRIIKPGVIPTLHLPTDKEVREIPAKKRLQFAFKEPRPAGGNVSADLFELQKEPLCSMTETPFEQSQRELQFAVNEEQCPSKQYASSSSELKRHHSSSSGTSTATNVSQKRKRKYIRMDHCYTRSPGHFVKQIKHHAEKARVYKSKFKSAKRTSRRRKQKITHLKEIVLDLKKAHYLSTTALEHLEQSFSGVPQALMNRMLSNNRRGKITRSEYPPELKRFAMTLQFYSVKAYRYVRKVFDLALPAESTIRAWLAKVDCEPGFSKPSLDALKIKAESYYECSKKTLLCSLMLDEMSIKKEVTVEPTTLKTRGYVDMGCDMEDLEELELAQEALVLMVVGVNDHFKVPIAYFFVNKLTAEEKANIMKEALTCLHSTGARILSITCDGPQVHFKMLKQLGCEIANLDALRPYFKHPVDGSKVFVFLDVCHMLKLIRNNWEKLGQIKDPDGQIINWNYIKELNNIQQKEGLILGNKLRAKHIKFRKAIMKVNLAAQTLSSSVADALEFLLTDLRLKNFEGAEATIKFIRVVDGLFDLLNSRNPFGRRYKAPLRIQNEDYWRPFMESGVDYLKKCRRLDGRLLTETPNKTPFVGFVVSASSLMQIYEEEVKPGNLKYLLGYKFSQDHLELFFCSIRSRNGWVVNPSCFQFIHTYKRLLMHNEVRDNSGNCLAQDQTTVLTVTSTQKRVQETDVFLQRQKEEQLDALNLQVEFSMPLLPTKLGEYAENVVAYIAGFVIKMIQRHNSCSVCLEALILDNDEDKDETSLSFIRRKSRGGLLWPSRDLREICFKIEKKIQLIFEMNNRHLPPKDLFINLLLMEGMNYYSDGTLLTSLDEHVFDTSQVEVPHKKSLIEAIIKAYAKIRLHSLEKTINENLGTSSRKVLSRLIIFKNQ